MHPDDRSGEMPTHRSFATIADLPFSEQKGPFRVGITLPITPEEWQRIRDILRARPEETRIDLSRYVNAANISAADVPHVVVEKLQRAINASPPPQQREPTPACNSATGACLSPRACDYEGKCRRDAAKQEEPK